MEKERDKFGLVKEKKYLCTNPQIMITTKSTFNEINKVLKAAYEPIMARAYGYSKANRKLLYALCQQHERYTMKHEIPYYTDGVCIRTVEIGVHIVNIDGEFRKKHKTIRSNVKTYGFDHDEALMYSILEDLETKKKVYVDYGYSWRLGECMDVMFVSTHGIQRYARRMFPDETLTFEETCSRLIRRSFGKAALVSEMPYGATNHHQVIIFIADGILLGYRDDERNVYCMDTFLRLDMLSEEFRNWIPADYKQLITIRDEILNHKPLSYRVSKGEMVPMKNVDGKLVEEEESHIIPIPEMDQEYIKEFRKAVRKHFVEKMKRKGYQ